jgi:hypothetical protein
VLKVTRAAHPRQNLMAHQSFIPQYVTQASENFKETMSKLTAEEIAAKK